MKENKVIKKAATFLLALALIVTCVPVNADTYTHWIRLTAKPGNEVSAELGQNVVLSVETETSDGLDPADVTYTWYRVNEGSENEKEQVYQGIGDEGKTYTVENFTKSCKYSCIATAPDSQEGYAYFHVYYENNFAVVDDNGEPQNWPEFNREYDFGQTVELFAEVTGKDTKDVTFKWYGSDLETPIPGATGSTFKINSLKAPSHYTMEATDKFGNVVYADFYISLKQEISYNYPKTVTVKAGKDAVINVSPSVSGKDLDTTGFSYDWSVYNEEQDAYEWVASTSGAGSYVIKNVTKDMKVKCDVYCSPEYEELYIDVKVDNSPETPSTEEKPSVQDTEDQKATTPVVSTVKASSIKITGISKKVAAGKKIKLQAAVAPQNATNKAVIWTSSNPKVATVDRAGVVKMNKKSAGKSVVITATAADGSGVKATYKIKSMKGIVKKVNVTGAKTVKAGKTLKLKAKVTATKGANKKVTWTSSNTDYATVTSSGKVKTLKAGKGKKVKITAMATDGSGKKKTVAIKIK